MAGKGSEILGQTGGAGEKEGGVVGVGLDEAGVVKDLFGGPALEFVALEIDQAALGIFAAGGDDDLKEFFQGAEVDDFDGALEFIGDPLGDVREGRLVALVGGEVGIDRGKLGLFLFAEIVVFLGDMLLGEAVVVAGDGGFGDVEVEGVEAGLGDGLVGKGFVEEPAVDEGELMGFEEGEFGVGAEG